MRWIPRIRFSVRTLMIMITLFGLALTPLVIKMQKARQQQRAVAWVLEQGGTVYYGYEQRAFDPTLPNDFSHLTFSVSGTIGDEDSEEPIETEATSDELNEDANPFETSSDSIPNPFGGSGQATDPFGGVPATNSNSFAPEPTSDISDEPNSLEEIPSSIDSFADFGETDFEDLGGSGVIFSTNITRCYAAKPPPRTPSWYENLMGTDFVYSVVEVHISNENTNDISALAELEHLEYVSLDGTSVTNLTPLANLHKLKGIDLANTPVTELSPLAKLKNVVKLDLTGTKVTDLTLLSKLTNLRDLYISDTLVTDLTPLANLKSLDTLFMHKTQVSDLTPLSQLSNLSLLYATETKVTDLSPLAGLGNLSFLSFACTEVNDLSPLAHLNSLISIDATDTQVSDITPVATLKGLWELDISETLVKDISPLIENKKLSNLDISGTYILDLSPLKKMKALSQIKLSGIKRTEQEISAIQSALPKCDIDYQEFKWPRLVEERFRNEDSFMPLDDYGPDYWESRFAEKRIDGEGSQ